MGNSAGTCNLQAAIDEVRQGPLALHLKSLCRCPLGGTFLRDYTTSNFTSNFTQPCVNGICSETDFDIIKNINLMVSASSTINNNSAIIYTATNTFPICYETFTGRPNQGVEEPFLIFVAALVYLLVLLYMFVGVALIADRFMASIEVRTILYCQLCYCEQFFVCLL